MLKKISVLGIGITDASEEEILEYIIKTIGKKDRKLKIVTPNPEMLVYANHSEWFRNILNDADVALADGVGVVLASRFVGKPIRQRITGVDLVKKLCEKVASQPITVGFLGGGPGVAEKTAECLTREYPGLKVVFADSEWPGQAYIESRISNFEKKDNARDTSFQIRNTIDILFVAFGFPKQEEWIFQNLPNIPVRVAMGVGGTFDYISGRVKRAPEFVGQIGFEWFYRLLKQPWRIKRQLALITFLFLVLREGLTKKT